MPHTVTDVRLSASSRSAAATGGPCGIGSVEFFGGHDEGYNVGTTLAVARFPRPAPRRSTQLSSVNFGSTAYGYGMPRCGIAAARRYSSAIGTPRPACRSAKRRVVAWRRHILGVALGAALFAPCHEGLAASADRRRSPLKGRWSSACHGWHPVCLSTLPADRPSARRRASS